MYRIKLIGFCFEMNKEDRGRGVIKAVKLNLDTVKHQHCGKKKEKLQLLPNPWNHQTVEQTGSVHCMKYHSTKDYILRSQAAECCSPLCHTTFFFLDTAPKVQRHQLQQQNH